MSSELTFSDYLAIRNVAFRWVEGYDDKNWGAFDEYFAPSIDLDFRFLQGDLHKGLTPAEFAAIISGPKVIGDKRVKTQHFLGASKWELLSDGTVQVMHQLRVAHQRYTDESFSEVVNKGHGHGYCQHRYKKIDGAWKIVSVVPRLEWVEYDLLGTLDPPEEASSKSQST